MMRHALTNRVFAGLTLAGSLVSAYAQDLRDPTLPPIAASAAPDAPAPSPLGGEGGMSVIVRDGKAGLVIGTRVVLPGQKVGPWTLDRITETEVWLRDGTTVRKVSRFSGIQRHDPAIASLACASPVVSQAAPKARGGKTLQPVPASQASPASTKVDPQCVAPVTRSSNP